jgi:hypothetical protein
MNAILQLTLIVSEILFFYDAPLLFSADSPEGAPFLFVLLDDGEGVYIGKEATPEEKSAFLAGATDLRSVYLLSEKPFLTGKFTDEDTFVCSELLDPVTEDMLPAKGLTYTKIVELG